MKPKTSFFTSIILASVIFILTGCSIPRFGSSPELPTATPARPPMTFPATFTSTPVKTPLFRQTEILEIDYGQTLTLYVGDTFELNRLEDDHYPLMVDNPQVLQISGDPRVSSVVLKAIAIGQARVTTEISFPCPAAPHGCQPPKTFEYVTVSVIAVISRPTTYPMALTVSPTDTRMIQTVKTPTYTPTPCPPFIIETKLPDPETLQSYIGHHFISSSTPGLKSIMGAAIGGQPDLGEFVLEEVWSSQHKMLWFEKLECRNDDGRPFFKIIDVLALPEMQRNEILVAQDCRQSGDLDIEIVVIGEFKKGEAPLTKITHAWRANRRTEKFEEISPFGIYCERLVGGD